MAVLAGYEYFFIPALPLLAFLFIAALATRRDDERIAPAFIITALLGSLALSGIALLRVTQAGPFTMTLAWLHVGQLALDLGVTLDYLSAVMMIVVCVVSLLVQIYSIGYMKGESGYGRYFAYMSLFSGSMLGLVISNNLAQTYIFWELVGICSYLLIGFWYRRPSAAAAAKKAFVVTRFGDLGFLAGILVISNLPATTFDFAGLAARVSTGHLPAASLTLISLLIFCGAVGKSAQFPLHIWLPDAMEGPTPVSALIHAATMVAAGVYLVARCYFLFTPESLLVVAIIGTITLFLAATMGVAENDIKRVMAYSTVSQLGYMMLALGVGGYAAGVFHLTTHAFFKALLFLTAGSVIHAVQTNNMWQMGGLRKHMPITALTCLVGALALAGVFPLSGFWSKDEILTAAYTSHLPGHTLFFAVAVAAAFLTAFYIFRLWFLTFAGAPRSEAAHHAHESPGVMTLPLLVLGALAVIAGGLLITVPGTGHGFGQLFETAAGAEGPAYGVMILSTVAALAGIALAYAAYGAKVVSPAAFNARLPFVYALFKNAWYLDRAWVWFATRVVLAGSALAAWFDRHVVDGMVNGVAWLCAVIGLRLRRAETGQLQTYAFVFIAGAILALGFIWVRNYSGYSNAVSAWLGYGGR